MSPYESGLRQHRMTIQRCKGNSLKLNCSVYKIWLYKNYLLCLILPRFCFRELKVKFAVVCFETYLINHNIYWMTANSQVTSLLLKLFVQFVFSELNKLSWFVFEMCHDSTSINFNCPIIINSSCSQIHCLFFEQDFINTN